MFKTISAALLAVSVLAAPAMAAGIAKTERAPAAPVVKSVQVKPALKSSELKPSVRNANARMGRHHHHFRHFRHHRFHKR